MRISAVLGWPVEHSKSPAMMNAAFAATGIAAEMIKIGVEPVHFAAKLRELRALPMLGASVTTPHKLAAHDACDELTPAAREIGAVNCLQLAGMKLIGHNTDAPGFVDAVTSAGLDLAGAHVVLLGAGGAARAVAYGCREAGAIVEVAARTPANVAWIAARPWTALAGMFAHAQLVVDCMSAELGSDPLDVPLDALPTSSPVATLVYHAKTDLLERASARGHSILDGAAMLLHQGARAFTLWTGVQAPLDAMAAALRA